MRFLSVVFVFFALSNSAWAAYFKAPVTEVSQDNEDYSGGTCVLEIKGFGYNFLLDLKFRSPGEDGISKHIEMVVKSGPPASLPPELPKKALGSEYQEAAMYSGKTLTWRLIHAQWTGKQNDPKNFYDTSLVEIDIVNGIDIGTISKVKYTYSSDSDDGYQTESITCAKAN